LRACALREQPAVLARLLARGRALDQVHVRLPPSRAPVEPLGAISTAFYALESERGSYAARLRSNLD
jgi:hypothetical protein